MQSDFPTYILNDAQKFKVGCLTWGNDKASYTSNGEYGVISTKPLGIMKIWSFLRFSKMLSVVSKCEYWYVEMEMEISKTVEEDKSLGLTKNRFKNCHSFGNLNKLLCYEMYAVQSLRQQKRACTTFRRITVFPVGKVSHIRATGA